MEGLRILIFNGKMKNLFVDGKERTNNYMENDVMQVFHFIYYFVVNNSIVHIQYRHNLIKCILS